MLNKSKHHLIVKVTLSKKYEGIEVRFLRKLEHPFTRRYEIGLQNN